MHLDFKQLNYQFGRIITYCIISQCKLNVLISNYRKDEIKNY
jgi:hypothetical protein